MKHVEHSYIKHEACYKYVIFSRKNELTVVKSIRRASL